MGPVEWRSKIAQAGFESQSASGSDCNVDRISGCKIYCYSDCNINCGSRQQ